MIQNPDRPGSWILNPNIAPYAGSSSAGGSGSSGAPTLAGGQAFPSYGEFMKGVPSQWEELGKTPFASMMSDPSYGQVPESQMESLLGPQVREGINTAMQGAARRYGQAGYAPQFNMAEATGRIAGGMAGWGAEQKLGNLQQGVQSRGQLYGNVLGYLQGDPKGMGAYLALLSRGIGTQLPGGPDLPGKADPQYRGPSARVEQSPMGMAPMGQGAAPNQEGGQSDWWRGKNMGWSRPSDNPYGDLLSGFASEGQDMDPSTDNRPGAGEYTPGMEMPGTAYSNLTRGRMRNVGSPFSYWDPNPPTERFNPLFGEER